VGYFYNFHVIAQSKQSPMGRNFAQSGHPALDFFDNEVANIVGPTV
jgi:hypothetical protein